MSLFSALTGRDKINSSALFCDGSANVRGLYFNSSAHKTKNYLPGWDTTRGRWETGVLVILVNWNFKL